MTKFLDADMDFKPEKLTYMGDHLEGHPFAENSFISYPDEEILIMHEWESFLMKAHADFVCEIGGDILEFGFGMGISANFIQEHNPKSHTIIEIHPQVIEKAKEWAADKPNVTIVEGNWIDVLPTLTEGTVKTTAKKFDGVFYDIISTPYLSDQHSKFPDLIIPHLKPKTRISHWNPVQEENCSACGFMNHPKFNITFDKIPVDVNSQPEGYRFVDFYYMPKVFLK